MKEAIQKVVLEGRWLYANSVEKPVYVIEQNYDYWFEMEKADGEIETGDQPDLNEAGLIYYIGFNPLGIKPWSVDCAGHKTIGEAKAFAAHKVNCPIKWAE